MSAPTPWLPAKTRGWIDDAVGAAERALGDGFVAAALVGAAATPSRQDRAQGPQVLVIAKALPMDAVRRLGEAARPAMKKGVRLRTLTSSELERSCDVFALEVAEWRDRHVLLAGDDPFARCDITDADLRHGLEAGFRGLKRRLRNRVLADLGSGGRTDHADAAIREALERLLALAHHALALDGAEPPREEPALIEAFAKAVGASPAPALALRARVRKAEPIRAPLEDVEALLTLIEPGADYIDQMEHGG